MMMYKKIAPIVTNTFADLLILLISIVPQLPQGPFLIVMKRGADLPRLRMEVVGITLICRCSNQSTLYARTVITVLASNRSFSHFHSQVEHNASLFQYVRVSYETRCKDSENLEELKPFSERTYENLA